MTVKSRRCPYCDDQISAAASTCPSCAETVQPSSAPTLLSSTPLAATGAVQGEKSAGLAIFLNFILPGVGHLYATGGNNGAGLLIASIVLGVINAVIFSILPPFAIPTFLALIFIWGSSMSRVGAIAKKYNEQLRAAAHEQQTQAETAVRQRAERSQNQKKMEERKRLEEQAETEREVTGKAVAEELSKLVNLKKMEIINDTELEDQKGALFKQLTGRYTKDSLGDFFMPIGKLVTEGDLTQQDLKKLKAVYASIHKP